MKSKQMYFALACAMSLLSLLSHSSSTSARAHLETVPYPSQQNPNRPIGMTAEARSGFLQFTSQGHILSFRAGEYYISNSTAALRVEFLDANRVAPTSGSPSETNEQGAPPLNRVTYSNLWNGVTLAYDSAYGGVVSSSYEIAPRADPRAIRLRYNTPLTLNDDGTLTIANSKGHISESAPIAWQEKGGVRVPVQVAFTARSERELGFAVGDYDASALLYIDPTLTWNTFLGADGYDFGYGMTVDSGGNVYVTGYSNATWGSPVRTFPYVGSGGGSAFVAKLNANGNLVWNTFLGGTDTAEGHGIAVDTNGNVYVAGWSNNVWGCSPTSCTVRAFTSFDAFVAKLDSSGNLTWNTFLGGTGFDNAYGVAVDGSGNVYVTGRSGITWGTPVHAHSGASGYDAFAAKLDSSGNLTWNTFLGGILDGVSYGIAVDQNSNVYVSGYTNSNVSWGSPIRSYSAGYDGFAAKLDSSGNLTWNTFLGGNGTDYAYRVAVDGSGNVYVAGSGDQWGSPVRPHSGALPDGFAAKLDSSGNLTWNTFLGGSATDEAIGIAVGASGNVYVSGDSGGTWGSPARAFTVGGGYDGYAAKVDSSGHLTWNSFLGGVSDDYGYDMAADGSGNIYLVGNSRSASWGSPIRAYTSDFDAFVVKLFPATVYLPVILK